MKNGNGNSMMIFAGNANLPLAKSITSHLNLNLGGASVGKFSDGEVMVEILENARGRDIFIIQPTCYPTNDNVMELMIMADALHRASANRITAVIPYFGYSRQDRRPRSARVPISAKVIANMISSVGVNRMLTVDLHADQIQGFFDIPVDNIYAMPIMVDHIRKKFGTTRDAMRKLTIISPDVGGVLRARAFAKSFDADLAIIDKRRQKANHSEVMNIIGDVDGKNCVIVDDIVDTAGTLCRAAEALKDQGAETVRAYCTHPILSGKAIENIDNSSLDELVVTNTCILREDAVACEKISQLDVSELLAETIKRIHLGDSVSCLFK